MTDRWERAEASFHAYHEADALDGNVLIGRPSVDATSGVSSSRYWSAKDARRLHGSSIREWARRELALERLVRLGAVTAQLVLLTAAIRFLNIETKAFEKVAMLALGGFLVNHFLPLRMRLPLFALLSVASVLMVFGVEQGLWTLGIGGMLIALCHVPGPMGARIVLVLLGAGLLAVARVGPEWVPERLRGLVPGTIWPILGAMFMFRLMVYMYDLKHKAAPFGIWRAMAYFFMLPNVCFSLFPVVDYRTFCRNHYNDDAIRIYQIGAKWILRGFVQLVIYKFVYMRCMIEPSDAATALDAAQYMLTTFLLYLKISGLFHVIVGMLHMYGFNLPETHHLYLLSSSFTDFWRRINIFWKDFIMKLVFYPLYFRWRKTGDSRAVALSTLCAFLATWLLHSYQWFWIRGTFPIVWSDLVFWLGLGIVVLLNVQWEQRRGRRRTLKKATRTVISEAGLALRTAGTFAGVCILWTVWSTPKLAELRFLVEAAANITVGQAAIIVAVPLGVGLVAVALGRKSREHTDGTRSTAVGGVETFWPSAVRVSLSAAAFIVVTLKPSLLMSLPVPSDSRAMLVSFLTDLREHRYNRGKVLAERLNLADRKALKRGYYEDLGDVTRFNNELWRLYGQRPKNWGSETEVMEERDDAIRYQYKPSIRGIWRGAMFTTNSAGMRDREYSKEKPVGVFRIALVGSSHDAGSGVLTEQTYENIIEERLNATVGGAGPRVEVLNFSVNGFNPVQKLAATEMRVPEYQPDVVMYAANSSDLGWTFRGLEKLILRGLVKNFPFFVEAMQKAGLNPEGVPERQIVLEHKLRPHQRETLRRIFERFGKSMRERGARPIVLLVEHPEDDIRPKSFDVMIEIGREAGVEVIDVYGAMAGVKDRSTLWVTEWDDHANPHGHAMIAEKLLKSLVERGIVPAGSTPAAQLASGTSPPE